MRDTNEIMLSFLRKQKDKEEEEERKKREKEDEIDEALRQRLLNMGWSKTRVDMEIDRERIRRKTTTTTTTTVFNSSSGNALVPLVPANRAPTYAKVKREHIATQTLEYFNIPWEYDRVSPTKQQRGGHDQELRANYGPRRINATSSLCAR